MDGIAAGSGARAFFPYPAGNHPQIPMPEASSGNAKQCLSLTHPGETVFFRPMWPWLNSAGTGTPTHTLTHTFSAPRFSTTSSMGVTVTLEGPYKIKRKAPRFQEQRIASILIF